MSDHDAHSVSWQWQSHSQPPVRTSSPSPTTRRGNHARPSCFAPGWGASLKNTCLITHDFSCSQYFIIDNHYILQYSFTHCEYNNTHSTFYTHCIWFRFLRPSFIVSWGYRMPIWEYTGTTVSKQLVWPLWIQFWIQDQPNKNIKNQLNQQTTRWKLCFPLWGTIKTSSQICFKLLQVYFKFRP